MKPIERHTLGGRLRSLREERDWKQWEVAEKVGCTRAAVAQYESNHHLPPLKTLEELASLYKVTVHYLLKGRAARDLEIHSPSELRAVALLRRAPPRIHDALLNVMSVQIDFATGARK
jgi:transcriptional regulator with XRE-family HTH domain